MKTSKPTTTSYSIAICFKGACAFFSGVLAAIHGDQPESTLAELQGSNASEFRAGYDAQQRHIQELGAEAALAEVHLLSLNQVEELVFG